MKKILLLFLLFTSLHWLQAQTIVYEDFEGGVPDISWQGLNGTFNGAVANPAPDGVNSSEFVGSYTNHPDFDFAFALGTLSAPVDLTTLSLIKMKVWSPIAPTQVLFKFEGGGGAVEMFRNITVANQWVEYSFDLSAGAAFTSMDKVLVAFNPFVLGSTETFYFDDITAGRAIEYYETFEGGAPALPWQALNGVLNAPVENPDSNSVNGSDNVGQYVKDTFEYSLLLADRGTPFDMSILNQFHLQVHAQAPTQVLLKLEGPGGPAIEQIKNIGLSNEWQDYAFDFSAAADYTHLTKVVLFFDPGVKTSVDTYYFDNLYAVPVAAACKGATPNPDMIDDFECNRNATYVNGWDSLTVVNNPEPNTVNTSAKVGKYVDPTAEPWATLLIDYQNPMNLTVKNQLKAKIWAPREVPILFKLEGGSSPAKEIWVNVTTPGEWVEYTVDFGDQALANHRKIAIFFNGGNDPQDGDVYYIDDIQWAERALLTIEDFEAGVILPWAPLDDQSLLHGTFQRVANPDPTGNTSAFVGKYTKGTSAFSTLAAVAPSLIDISSRPQYNLDVYAPGPGTVIMQLESVSQGNKEVERTIEEGGVWQTLSFDFSEHQGITDWASLKLIFNPGVAEEGAMFFFDNLTQGASTVDPCEGVVPVTHIIDDFECQRNYGYLAGADLLSVVGNPLVSTENSSTFVGLYMDQPNEPWAPLCVDFAAGMDLSAFNQLSLQILAEEAVPILLKLEGGTVSSPVEVWTAVTKPGEWETITGDFSSQVGADHTRACIFFNGGVTTTEVDNYYIDNLQFAHAPFTGCLINFDDAAFISDEWKYFPSDDSGDFAIVPNPDPSGINLSPLVGQATEKATSGQPWQGMYTDLPAPIVFGTDKIVTMKVWSPKVTTVTMKLEVPLTPGAPGSSGDLTVPMTTSGEWEELSFDFSTAPNPIPDDGKYTRVTLIWDINNIPAEDVIYYFDDISLTTGECAVVSSNEPPKVPELTVSPNPVTDNLFVKELGKVSRLDVYNLYGQRISSKQTGDATSTYISVSNLYQGTYILAGYGAKGELLALSRFVKL